MDPTLIQQSPQQASPQAPLPSLPQFSPAKKRDTAILVVRLLVSGDHYIVVSLSTRDETLLLRIDPVDGALRFEWKPGVTVFTSELKAIESLMPFGELDVSVRASAFLGYAVLNEVACLLLATRVRPAMTMPGGHQILTVTESQWIKIPLQGGSMGRQLSREELRKVDSLLEFPLDGAHFFCETADATRPFPSEHSPSDPAWEWVWNRWLSSPLRALNLHDVCPNLQQGMAEARQLEDLSGQPWVLGEISRRSRLHAGTRYLARGLNCMSAAANEIECEQLVWRIPSGGGEAVQWSNYFWRRGSVPIWWGVEIKNAGMGEAGITINPKDTYRGTAKYFKRVQRRYVPRQSASEEPSAELQGSTVPVVCINLLRCAMGRAELVLSEHFHEAMRHVRRLDPATQVKVLNFDWHATVKSLGEHSAVEGLWSLLTSMQPGMGISCGTMVPAPCSPAAESGLVTTWPGSWQMRWQREQRGLFRFNCADSLDRTNVASYFAATQAVVEQTKSCSLYVVGSSTRGLASAASSRSGNGAYASINKVLSKSVKSVDQVRMRMMRPGFSFSKSQGDLGGSAGVDELPNKPEPPSEPKLPRGWESRKDPVTGRTFYIDHINKATTWKCPEAQPDLEDAANSENDAAGSSDSDDTSGSELSLAMVEMPAVPDWGLFGWTVPQVKAYLMPSVVTTQADLFLINGDLQAMFYTASRAMHSQSICLLEGKRSRLNHTSGMGVAINAGLAVQRRFNNLLQDEYRMAQMEMFLGLKSDVHFPNVTPAYTEAILPNDVSDTEDRESEMCLFQPLASQPGDTAEAAPHPLVEHEASLL
mmetsp:Transcript_40321/g.114154  ORF Transcript_40321/g.114154 Transcript_40321/m.114154 type:complete len:819 (+) Transcript_40321:201-2657(+)|eukprot:CAMPEP_0117651946 /NCGR_PEP_ID=MMETSP0804-20121206/2366_1 /TAXON_ID=1074897 /ORGANISM="Tetraselmis astigmatica, Strain CCMP880" /LENGTH=818 /DNA_ID=CAMNT_0005457963 /DNA_START=150 /DNA_END=2606 /DNA_ORIENTATION=-